VDFKLDKILCIDDDPDILAIVKVSLEVFGGYTLRTCSGGRDGLREAADWHPDLIITDVMMPELDGVATFKLLRENQLTAQIPVMFMTARVERSQQDEYRRMGAASVIQKPFDPVTLAAEVDEHWRHATV
jgi:two-component system OmpR family response regulator